MDKTVRQVQPAQKDQLVSGIRYLWASQAQPEVLLDIILSPIFSSTKMPGLIWFMDPRIL